MKGRTMGQMTALKEMKRTKMFEKKMMKEGKGLIDKDLMQIKKGFGKGK